MARRRLQFDMRTMLLLLTVSSAGVWWWVTWPQRTWRGFVRSFASGNADAANNYCLTDTIRVRDTGTPFTQVELRTGGGKWVKMTLDRSRFDVRLPQKRSAMEVLMGVAPVGPRGSLAFGHLEVRRNRIVFVSD